MIESMIDLVAGLQPRYRRIEIGCRAEAADSETLTQKLKQIVVNVDREHRDGCTN